MAVRKDKERNSSPQNNERGEKETNGKGRSAKNPKRTRRNRNNTTMDSNNSRSINPIGKGNYDSSDNDASWYMRYPELAKDASKLPFTTPLGKYPYVSTNGILPAGKFKTGAEAFGIPGIMAINWFPTIGQSDDPNSPVNIVSREIYSFVRHANSGHSNYDAPDLMMYILSMDSLYSFYAAMVRVYGVMMLYNGMNRYMPKRLVEALGFDFDNISANLAQFRWLINQVAYKLTALYVPLGMSYFERHIWLNSGLYVDSSSIKAQTYVFKQNAYYIYSATAATNYAAKLNYTEVPNKLTLSKCQDFVNSMLDPILSDEDMNIISGDMLRAFGADNLFTVAPIADDYVVVPSYSQEVLSQIQNLTIMGTPNTTIDTNNGFKADIVQRINTEDFTPGVYQFLTFDGNFINKANSTGKEDKLNAWACTTYDKLVTMLTDNPTAEEIMVATRLTNIANAFAVREYTDKSTTYRQAHLTADMLSTEVVTDIDIYNVRSNGQYVSHSVSPFVLYGSEVRESPLRAGTNNVALSLLSAFDWHPTVYLMHSEADDDSVIVDGTIVEFNNFTTVDRNDLQRLHETALISEFFIPDVRKLSAKPVR